MARFEAPTPANTGGVIAFLKSLFQTPQFAVGVRVNRLHQGKLNRIDGRVMAQTHEGVLVEWPRNGTGWEHPGALCQQG